MRSQTFQRAAFDRAAGEKVDTTESSTPVTDAVPSPTAAESKPSAVVIEEEAPFDDTEMFEDVDDEEPDR